MQTITVVGAGFSGLVTAYYLSKAGFKVRVFESGPRPGGLLRTIRTEHGPVETAANSIRNSGRLEALCEDIGVPLQALRPTSRARFIYRNQPRRWPVTVGETTSLVLGLGTNALSLRPRRQETIDEWGLRVIGAGATEYFLAPALSGIYAGDPKKLSASLIFGRNANGNKPPRPKVRGTVTPVEGMQQLVDGLCNYLARAGIEIAFNQSAILRRGEPAVICTSALVAAECLRDIAPDASRQLARIDMLPLVTATCFYPSAAARLKGFGCLFPRPEGFRARGVLFNSFIFEGRGPAHSETWIFGGAFDREIMSLDDETLGGLIADERSRFYGRHDQALSAHITRWPSALPHYTVELENILEKLPALPDGVALVGNYLGKIGLSGIIDRAVQVATNFKT